MNQIHRQTIMLAVLVSVGGMLAGKDNACAASSSQRESSPSKESMDLGGQRVVSEPTDHLLPGNQLVLGRINDIRSNQIEIDIGNLQPLFVPLKPAQQKGQTFKPGDAIVVTINDHNAVVDYHHPDEASHHQVLRGRLKTPLTVGLDKAIIQTERGDKSFIVAERARGKLSAMPVGPELWFMADETGQLVDAQLASKQAVQESAELNKARIKGAHRQMRVVFKGVEAPSSAGGEGRLKIVQEGREQNLPYRPPLDKLDRLQSGQDVVLLMDDHGYVLEIATPEVAPTR
ncbi:MAG: hypothetical protein Nkreftii_002323 [Candidatus Nitrospira kreftii]|uniref:Uncharacterized protein n=1 Tax=Candidatus Nitrospira kreftii TaxID=2652173 RepID=A0A7S8FEG7_9BACT|nr:MAG: hypothetical protein Nkreftii_002323 [Candidatus Nitrospira kreftii]